MQLRRLKMQRSTRRKETALTVCTVYCLLLMAVSECGSFPASQAQPVAKLWCVYRVAQKVGQSTGRIKTWQWNCIFRQLKKCQRTTHCTIISWYWIFYVWPKLVTLMTVCGNLLRNPLLNHPLDRILCRTRKTVDHIRSFFFRFLIIMLSFTLLLPHRSVNNSSWWRPKFCDA